MKPIVIARPQNQYGGHLKYTKDDPIFITTLASDLTSLKRKKIEGGDIQMMMRRLKVFEMAPIGFPMAPNRAQMAPIGFPMVPNRAQMVPIQPHPGHTFSTHSILKAQHCHPELFPNEALGGITISFAFE